MNILFTWIGKHDCESLMRQVDSYGPIERIIASKSYQINEVFALYQSSYTGCFNFDSRQFAAKLQDHYGCRFFTKPIDDDILVSDIGIIHEVLKSELTKYLSYKKIKYDLFFNTSSGTNAITVSMIMLGRTIFDATLLQTWVDNEQHKTGVEIVNFPFLISYDVLQKQLSQDTKAIRPILFENHSLNVIIGKCQQIMEAKKETIQYSIFDKNLLLVGESGTGKELFAALYRSANNRDSKKFFAFNCANLSDQLAESELFGHRKGAFTDAKSDKEGLFKIAHGGILFLDEIGELSDNLQAKLLRVLEDGNIRPLGCNKAENVDVRVIGATNNPQKLRLDLYYRLAEGIIELPPLRERGEDAIMIADKILEVTNDELKRSVVNSKEIRIDYIPKSFDESAYDFIRNHTWDGNVRELKTVIKRCCILTDVKTITLEIMQKECYKRFYTKSSSQVLELPLKDNVDLKLSCEFDLMSELQKIKMYAINESIRLRNNQTKAAKSLGFNSLQAMKNHMK